MSVLPFALLPSCRVDDVRSSEHSTLACCGPPDNGPAAAAADDDELQRRRRLPSPSTIAETVADGAGREGDEDGSAAGGGGGDGDGGLCVVECCCRLTRSAFDFRRVFAAERTSRRFFRVDDDSSLRLFRLLRMAGISIGDRLCAACVVCVALRIATE